MSLPFRQIHLDFHTAEGIPDIGAEFDAEVFTRTLSEAAVNAVTLFAKCHHGWSYYPTRYGRPHPALSRPDLLGEMVTACRKANIAVSIYLTVQWDELTAREHPEWRVVRARAPGPECAEWNQLSAGWHPLSLANTSLVDRIVKQAEEVVERYSPDGLFFDILLTYDDVSQAALDRMRALRLDPNKAEDRAKSERGTLLAFTQRIHSAIQVKAPGTRLFHNSGHIAKNERERWEHFSHFELESLPTGGWGYDHFPISAAYVAQLGKPYLGMTGKFHTTWGEFGGYKRPVALEYECTLMMSMGARCSIGDQLHPSGKLDPDTYRIIGPAYRRIAALESYMEGASPVAEVAIFSAEGHHRSRDHECSDIGAARILLELQVPFSVIGEDSDFAAFRLIILPDSIRLDDTLSQRFKAYVASGGALILSGASGLAADADAFAVPFAASPNGLREFEPDYLAVNPLFDPDLVVSPFVMYERAHSVKNTGAEVIGRLHDPYFNRTWEHFCSHQHTPPRPLASTSGEGILRDGSILYFAHPVFRLYHAIGQPLYKYLLRGALKALLPSRKVEVSMPSGGRINLFRNDQRLLLHLLYSPLQTRGNSVQTWHGKRPIEIIEESIPLYNVPCSVAVSSPPRRVYDASTGKDVPFHIKSDRVEFVIETVDLHALIVIEEGVEPSAKA